jgi:hypothetical protein
MELQVYNDKQTPTGESDHTIAHITPQVTVWRAKEQYEGSGSPSSSPETQDSAEHGVIRSRRPRVHQTQLSQITYSETGKPLHKGKQATG